MQTRWQMSRLNKDSRTLLFFLILGACLVK